MMIIYLWVVLWCVWVYFIWWVLMCFRCWFACRTRYTYVKSSEMRSVHMILSKLSFFIVFLVFYSFSSLGFFVERQTKQLWKLGQFAINPINAISESNFMTWRKKKKRFGTFGWFFISLLLHRCKDLCTLAHLCVISFSDIFISFIHLDGVLWSMPYLRAYKMHLCVLLIVFVFFRIHYKLLQNAFDFPFSFDLISW